MKTIKFYVGWKDSVKQLNKAIANIIVPYDSFYLNPNEIYNDVMEMEQEEIDLGIYKNGHYVIFDRSDNGTRIYSLNAFRKEFLTNAR